MQLTLALNIAWGLVAFTAVLWFALAERKTGCARGGGGKVRRIAAVLLAVCLLFPCVSASDDILGFSLLRHSKERPAAPSKQVLHLERVLQELENLQVCAAFIFVLTLCCIGLVQVFEYRDIARQLPCSIGRGPPAVV